MKKHIFLICSILGIGALLLSCEKKEISPCLKEHSVSNCSELFDSIQANMTNYKKLNELQDCYNANCKE